jgi:histidyl-tRNA synthetase
VQSLLKSAGTPFTVNPLLVRGLDYYSRTVFEFRVGNIGSQDAIAGGGRYDSLIASMGGPAVPAIGWAMGADRVIASMPQNAEAEKKSVFIICLSEAAVEASFALMQSLRKSGMTADSAAFSQSLKAQMRAADKSGAKFAAILGEDELKDNSCALKNLKTGEQQKLPQSNLPDFLKNNI